MKKRVISIALVLSLVLPIIPRFTQAEETWKCGLEEHIHEEVCYQQETVCGQEADAAHTHGDGCFETQNGLICTIPETHAHAETCSTLQRQTICTLPQAHTHADACYGADGVLVCTLPQAHDHVEACTNAEGKTTCGFEQAHVHEETCYKETTSLTCTLPEKHEHSDACYGDLQVQVCLVHVHTNACQGAVLVCEKQEHTHGDTCLCSCETACTEEKTNEACPVCTAGNADLTLCQGEVPAVLCAHNEEGDCAVCAVEQTIEALPTAEEWLALTEEEQRTEVYNAAQAVADQYNALTEEQQGTVSNADKLMELHGAFSQQTTPTLNYSGTCGENLTWKLENGVLTISGTGAMYDYEMFINVSPWHRIPDTDRKINSILIEPGVSHIGQYAFWGTNVSNVTIADSVTSIGSWAFWCGYLSTIVFEGNAPDIDKIAFLDVTATAYYPQDNTTWTASPDPRQNYGGTLTWLPYEESACQHTNQEEEWDADYPMTYTSISDTQHTVSGYANKYCMECFEDIGESYPLTETEDHSFNANGDCTLCKYYKNCPHLATVDKLAGTTYKCVSTTQHEKYDVYDKVCATESCSAVLEKWYRTDTVTEDHDQSDSCTLCGYGPLSVMVTEGTGSVHVGEEISATAEIAGGSGVYTIVWKVKKDADVVYTAVPTSVPTFKWQMSEPGSYSITAEVSESFGANAAMSSGAIQVMPHAYELAQPVVSYEKCEREGYHFRTEVREKICSACGDRVPGLPVSIEEKHNNGEVQHKDTHPHACYSKCKDCGEETAEGYNFQYATWTQSPEECCVCHGHAWSESQYDGSIWYKVCGKCKRILKVDAPVEEVPEEEEAEGIVSAEERNLSFAEAIFTPGTELNSLYRDIMGLNSDTYYYVKVKNEIISDAASWKDDKIESFVDTILQPKNVDWEDVERELAKEIICSLLDYDSKNHTDFKSLVGQIADNPISEIAGVAWVDYVGDFIGEGVSEKWGVYASAICEAIGEMAEMCVDFAAIDGVTEWEITHFQSMSSTYLANYEILTRIMENMGGTFGLACLDIRSEMMKQAYANLEVVIQERRENKVDRFVQMLGNFGVLAAETVAKVTISELPKVLSDSLNGMSSGVAIAQIITAGKYDARNSTIALNMIENDLRDILLKEQRKSSGDSEEIYETLKMLLLARKVGIEKLEGYTFGIVGETDKEFKANLKSHKQEVNDLLETLDSYYTTYDLLNGGDGLYGY